MPETTETNPSASTSTNTIVTTTRELSMDELLADIFPPNHGIIPPIPPGRHRVRMSASSSTSSSPPASKTKTSKPPKTPVAKAKKEKVFTTPGRAAIGWLKFLGNLVRKDGKEDKERLLAEMKKMVSPLNESLVLLDTINSSSSLKARQALGKGLYDTRSQCNHLGCKLERVENNWNRADARTQALEMPYEVYEGFFRELGKRWELWVSPDRKNFTFTVPLPPFVLEDKGLKVKFQGISLHICGVDKTNLCYSIRSISTVAGRKKRGIVLDEAMTAMLGKRHCHPHVSSGRLCVGEGRDPIDNAKRKWDIITLCVLVRNTLHTYYGDGAYHGLGEFTTQEGLRCNIDTCRIWIPRDDIEAKTETCSICRGIVCKKHIVMPLKKPREKSNKKPPVLKCGHEGCDRTPSPTVALKRNGITKPVCKSCMKGRATSHPAYKCSGCGELFCSSHIYACSGGSHNGLGENYTGYSCRNCRNHCFVCAGRSCNKHFDSPKGVCNYCKSHRKIRVSDWLSSDRGVEYAAKYAAGVEKGGGRKGKRQRQRQS